ncbi:hypothetical protein, partial [Oleiagrimonas sp.]|uniref:hypothetical protein n=1 Tax=Oleiagrimonas sp. TaxID=2010330 RepID=UPI002631BD49
MRLPKAGFAHIRSFSRAFAAVPLSRLPDVGDGGRRRVVAPVLDPKDTEQHDPQEDADPSADHGIDEEGARDTMPVEAMAINDFHVEDGKVQGVGEHGKDGGRQRVAFADHVENDRESRGEGRRLENVFAKEDQSIDHR